MAITLCRDMSLADQMTLANMTHHPGFEILTRIIDEACREIAAEPIKIDPATERYAEKVANAAIGARYANTFASLVRNSVLAHVNAAVSKAKHDQEEAQMDAEAEALLMTLKNLSQQDNTE